MLSHFLYKTPPTVVYFDWVLHHLTNYIKPITNYPDSIAVFNITYTSPSYSMVSNEGVTERAIQTHTPDHMKVFYIQ